MKKVLKISGIALASIFLLLLLLPLLFQGRIVELVKNEANEMLDAKVDFGRVSLSLIRNFPNASIAIHDFSIVGINDFENDTLAALDRIFISVNLRSLFADQIEINRISIRNPKVLAKVLADGQVNWDIMRADDEEIADYDEPTPFALHLRELSIRNGHIIYKDLGSNMKSVLENLNLTLSGNFTEEITTLMINAGIENLSFYTGNIAYLSNAEVTAQMAIEADLKNMRFTFSDNELFLNRIKMNFDGWLAMLDEGFDMDIRLNTPGIEFSDLLSLVPAVYAQNLDGIDTSGNVQLDAEIKGVFAGEVYPMFNIALNVSDAFFSYPDLPKSIDNININAAITNPGGSLDLTVVDISQFNFQIDRNPFNVRAKIATPMSDLAFDFGARGRLDLNTIQDVFPLEEGVDIAGILNTDFEAAGRMSHIENEQFEAIRARGFFELSNFVYRTKDMLPMLIDTRLNFTQRFVELANLNLTMGNNDIQARGRLENFIPFVLSDGTIRGTLTVASTLLNVDDFMGTEETEQAEAAEPLSLIEIPKNVDFRLNAALRKVTYGDMILENINGVIRVVNGKLIIDNAEMNAFGGQMTARGHYSTENIENPNVDFDLNIRSVQYSEIFRQLSMIQQFAPIFENLQGTFSTTLRFSSRLNPDMSLVYPSVSGRGVLTSRDLLITDVNIMNRLADVLRNETLRSTRVDDLRVAFSINNGRLATEPFNIRLGNANMNVSGSMGLDQTIDYVGQIVMPQEIGGIPITMNLRIGGTFLSPEIRVDVGDMVTAVRDAVTEEVRTVVDEGLQRAISEARSQRDRLVAEAERQGATIRSEANRAGERLVDEAQRQRDNLISEARNPIARAAAERAGDALVREAEGRANELNRNADNQANRLVDTAREQGDRLVREVENRTDN